MAYKDGALIVDASVNNSGVFKGAREFKRACQSLLTTAVNVGKAMGRAGDAYLRSVSKQGQAARDVNKQLDTMRQRYAAIVREMNKIASTDGKTDRYYKLSEEAKTLTAQMQKLRGAKQSLGGVEQGFEDVAQSAGRARQTIVGMISGGAWGFLKRLASGAKNAAVALAKLAGRAVVSGLKKIGQYAGQAAKRLFHLGRGARQSGGGFQFSLKNLLRYGLGIRSLFVLFNRLRSAIKEGFAELSKSDPRVRASLKTLSASLNSLKGSLAAAFAPILTAIAPALTTFINLLTQAINAVGMFFAALTGQSVYSVAKGIGAIDSNAKGASNSTKELKRQLAGFDELNILSANNGGGSGSGGTGYSYSQVPISEGIKGFVEQIKELFANGEYEQIGRVLADGLNKSIQKVQDFIKWDNIGPVITKWLTAITDGINGFFRGFDWKNLGATIAEGINTIVNTLLLWYENIDWAALGRGLADSLNALIRRINWTSLGDLITAKVKSILDFPKNFVITFDAAEAARKIREALGNIPWASLASEMWETAQAAFNKAGDFLYVLLGGDIPNYGVSAGDMLAEKLAIKNGRTASEGFGSLVSQLTVKILDAIKKAFEGIPWTDWGDRVHQFLMDIEWADVATAFWNAIVAAATGLGDLILAALFGKDSSTYKMLHETGGSGALGGIVAATTLFGKSIFKSGNSGAASLGVGNGALGTGVNLLTSGSPGIILKALGLTGVAGYLAGNAIYDSFIKEGWHSFIEGVTPAITKFVNDRTFEPGKKYEGTGNALADVGAWLFGGTQALDKIESAGGKLATIAADFIRNGGDAEGWNRLFNASDAEAKVQYDPGDRFHFEIEGGDYEGWSKLFEDNTDALEKNTKSNVKQTKATSTPTKIGGILKNQRDYDNRWMFAGSVEDVNIPVNFLPANMTQYINKPLEWLNKVFAPGTDTDARVQLLKQGWTSIAAFVGTTSPLSALLGLVRNGWSSLTSFVGTNNPISALLGLVKNGWTTLKSYTESNSGGNTMQAVNLSNGWGYKTVNDWVGLRHITGMVLQAVNLTNGWGYNSVNDWVGLRYITNKVAQAVDLRNGWGYSSVNDWVGFKYITGNVVQKVDLVLNKVSGVAGAFKVVAAATGGVIRGSSIMSFARGGSLVGNRGSWWNSIQKYASGSANAYGTLFAAGEAGPEVVGHINGRTEILNKSQLAQTMASAVTSGMVAAMRAVTFKMPAMATGSIMPYEVSAQIAQSTDRLQHTLDANNEDLIQTIISVIGAQTTALVNALANNRQTTGGMTAQQVINEINRRTQMFSASPLKGV